MGRLQWSASHVIHLVSASEVITAPNHLDQGMLNQMRNDALSDQVNIIKSSAVWDGWPHRAPWTLHELYPHKHASQLERKESLKQYHGSGILCPENLAFLKSHKRSKMRHNLHLWCCSHYKYLVYCTQKKIKYLTVINVCNVHQMLFSSLSFKQLSWRKAYLLESLHYIARLSTSLCWSWGSLEGKGTSCSITPALANEVETCEVFVCMLKWPNLPPE